MFSRKLPGTTHPALLPPNLLDASSAPTIYFLYTNTHRAQLAASGNSLEYHVIQLLSV